jgi:predicted  nucleic acid-binding Zn-ribbon protein
MAEERESLATAVTQLSKTAASLWTQYKSFKAQMVLAIVNRVESERELRSAVRLYEMTAETRQTEILSLNQRIQLAAVNQNAANTTILRLTNERTTLRQQLEHTKTEQRNQIAEINLQITALANERTTLRQQLEQSTATIAELNLQIAAEANERMSLDQQLQQSTATETEQRNQIAEINLQITALANERTTLRQRLEQSTATIAELNLQITASANERTSLDQQLQQSTTLERAQRDQITALTTTINQSRQDIQRALPALLQSIPRLAKFVAGGVSDMFVPGIQAIVSNELANDPSYMYKLIRLYGFNEAGTGLLPWVPAFQMTREVPNDPPGTLQYFYLAEKIYNAGIQGILVAGADHQFETLAGWRIKKTLLEAGRKEGGWPFTRGVRINGKMAEVWRWRDALYWEEGDDMVGIDIQSFRRSEDEDVYVVEGEGYRLESMYLKRFFGPNEYEGLEVVEDVQ